MSAASAEECLCGCAIGLARLDVGGAPEQPARERTALGQTYRQELHSAGQGFRPGFNRIDSVHQGDLDGVEDAYHINAVECVTQWEVAVTVQGLSEAFLLPVIARMPSQVPFELHGFHSDNGSKYVNRDVAAMLETLRVEFTRSRLRRSNDYGLAKTKNGAVIRKLFGYDHNPQRHAVRFDNNIFRCEQLNSFFNHRRPCMFLIDRPDPKKSERVTHHGTRKGRRSGNRAGTRRGRRG